MSAPFRPLLPAIPGAKRRNPAVPPEKERKRERISAACKACRLHKSKVTLLSTRSTGITELTKLQCSGERPTCTACAARKTACRYVETEARQVRRKYEDLRKHRSTHEELLGLMRTLPERDAVDLFHQLRAGRDVGAILNQVRDGDLLLQMHLVPDSTQI